MFSSCTSKCRIENIDVPETIIINSEEKGIDYCELLEKSVKKDKKSIVKLSLLDFDSSVGYEHGSILVDLIRIIGEEVYIASITEVSVVEKKKIEAFIEIGLMYHSDDSLKEKSIENFFPKLSFFLEN